MKIPLLTKKSWRSEIFWALSLNFQLKISWQTKNFLCVQEFFGLCHEIFSWEFREKNLGFKKFFKLFREIFNWKFFDKQKNILGLQKFFVLCHEMFSWKFRDKQKKLVFRNFLGSLTKSPTENSVTSRKISVWHGVLVPYREPACC